MNKEQLEKEIVELEKQKQQLIANVNACEGAIMAYKKMIVSLGEKDAITPDVIADATVGH